MRRARRWGSALVLAGLGLTGCATPPAATVPSDASLLTTRAPAIVLDDGSGPELCLGAIAASMPPQCSGPRLIGWDWNALPDEATQSMGVRWGTFTVVGTYDADADEFVVTSVASGAEATRAPAEPYDFTSPCAPPEGGWQVPDPARADDAALQAALARADTLPDLGQVWLDQSPNPAAAEADLTPEETETLMNDPALTILNVSVTGDPAEAEAALREVWGGMLCVSAAGLGGAELDAISAELASDLPGLLTSGRAGIEEFIAVSVVHDDGTLQRELDERYGAGVVRVESALVPVA